MPDQGVDQLRALSRRLKDFGDKGMKREFSREVAAVMKPLRTSDLPQSARENLPREGGLNEKVAKTVYRIVRRTGTRSAGLRLVGRNMYNIYRMNKGQNRHPIPNTNKWTTQRITPGWFDKPTNRARPAIQSGMVRAMDRMARQIDGRERPRNDTPQL